MFYGKYLPLILFVLSLFFIIGTVSAENINLSSDCGNHVLTKSNIDLQVSNVEKNLISTTQKNTTILSDNSKKAPEVWISKITYKSNGKSIIKLKNNKKGNIYYTTDGKNPTNHSHKYKNHITLSSNKVLKFIFITKDGKKSKINSYKRILGKSSKGYVEKLYYGNLSSHKTIVLVVGVHVQEYGMHKAIYKSLAKQNSKLKRKFVLYYIHVTKDKNNYEKSRMNGQHLCKYIVNDISHEKPLITTDIHETNYKLSGYKYPRFIHMISNNHIKSVKINKNLHKTSSLYLKRLLKLAPHIKRFDPQLGSSPAYLTVPIANKNLVSYIYETELSYSTSVKQSYADKYVKALDKVNLSI